MSSKVTGWAFEQRDWSQDGLDEKVAPSTLKFVLVAIADHASPDGSNAWPSVERISGMTELGERTVRRAISRLEELGYLRVERQRGGPEEIRDDRRPNRFRVLIDRITRGVPFRQAVDETRGAAPAPGPDDHGVPETTTRGAGNDHTGCRSGTQTNNRTVHEPLAGDTPAEEATHRHPTDQPDPTLAPLPGIDDARSTDETATATPTEGRRTVTPDDDRDRRLALERVLRAELGHEPATGTERARWNAALRELLDAGATAADLSSAIERFRVLHPRARLTPHGIASNYGALTAPAPVLQLRPPAPPERVECDTCDGTRFVPTADDAVSPCPDCHPNRKAAP